MNKAKSIIMTIVFTVFIFSVSAICYFKPDTEFSDSERRLLAKKPILNMETVSSGSFMKEFETYTADQFPARDFARGIKVLFAERILMQAENNGVFRAQGHLSKLDEKEDENMLNYAADIFKKLADENMKDKNANIYFSIVPDKNYYLAEKNGYPSLDYDKFIEKMRDRTPFMKYIDITKHLSLNDYYTTDTHWKQEEITDIAQHIASQMGTDVKTSYTINVLEKPFQGVYSGQYALPVESDTIKYLTNDTLDSCTVTYYNDMGLPVKGDMYNMEKANGKDPYEMFLSGSESIVIIENPNAKTDKELVIFRDSFGSSLAPLFAEGYKKITVFDIRYMLSSSYVGAFADFENSDVLFIYSTSLLNNSTSLKP